MRTATQLDNFRRLLEIKTKTDLSSLTYLELEDIANGVQSSFTETMREWCLRVRLKSESDTPIEEIPPSSETPYQTATFLKTSCVELLKKYDAIDSIMFEDKETGAVKILVTRED